jgi:MFS family permease
MVATEDGTPARPEEAGPGLAAVPEVAKRRWLWEALYYPDFGLYFAGSVVSNLGTWLQNTAQALLAYQLTHHVLAIGLVVCAQFCWVLLFGTWAGKLVSRTESVQRLVILTQVASSVVACAMAVLQLQHLLTVPLLIAGALLLGLAYCLALPATAVLVPAFVPERESDLETQRAIRAAVALDSASYNIGRCVAPLLAVLVVIRVGFGLAFALNALSFLVLAAALAMAHPSSNLRPNRQARIRDGFSVISKNRKIRNLLLIVAAVTITADPVLVLGPALAHHFHLPEAWAGYFLSALGGGTILASFLPLPPPSKVRHAAYPLFFLGAAVAVFGFGINPWWSLAAAGVAGVACLITGSTARALLWAFVPQDQEGQRPAIMAMWAVAWAGSKPLASLVDGVLATFIGTWAVGALSWEVPSVQAAGVLLAIPALIPALIPILLLRDGGAIPRLLGSMGLIKLSDQTFHMG